MGYFSRRPDGPYSNDPPPQSEEDPWSGANELVDEIALLLSGDAKRCSGCKWATHVRYLDSGLCPNCYQAINGKESPALERLREQTRRAHTGCASGEPGEAD